ncbi:unnamed protein product [Caenorhabditis sp. 36 PRJEB53466]|nr:unnamed protein product [Caenorhabditis sp. 36 PRJEB53466]
MQSSLAIEQDKIDSLLKLNDENCKNLRILLQKNTQSVIHVNDLMSARVHRISEKRTAFNQRFDTVHRNNQKLIGKIRENLVEIDFEGNETLREYEDIRRKVSVAKRHMRGFGLTRSLGLKLYNYALSWLISLGLYKPPKNPLKETKKCAGLLQVSRSEHVLTLSLQPELKTNPVTDQKKKKKQ